MVEIESSVRLETEQVTKGLPRTRKKRRLEEGKSRVTLRSLNEEILCVSWELEFCEAEMVRSSMKIWYRKAELKKRDG